MHDVDEVTNYQSLGVIDNKLRRRHDVVHLVCIHYQLLCVAFRGAPIMHWAFIG